MTKISYQDKVLEPFIPLSREELVEQLLQYASDNKQRVETKLDAAFLDSLQQFFKRYRLVSRAKLNQQYSLIDDYLWFSPDRDTLIQQLPQESEFREKQERVIAQVDEVLEKANFTDLSEQQLNQSLAKISPDGVSVSVDFSAYEEIKVYYRGVATRRASKRLWSSLWLKKVPIEVQVYRRLFLLLKPKSLDSHFDLQEMGDAISDKERKKLLKQLNLRPEVLDGHTIMVKLFKDIPQSDLEMLFPNTKIRMKLWDKVRLGLTGGGGTIGGISATAGKLATTMDPIAIVMALGGFAGILWRQIAKVFSQRTKYMARLSKHLYYYNMDNNRGALSHVLKLAEAEQNKEAFLAYFFLNLYGSMSMQGLDKRIEDYLAEQFDIAINYQVEEPLNQLMAMGLVSEQEGQFNAIAPQQGAEQLAKIWAGIIA